MQASAWKISLLSLPVTFPSQWPVFPNEAVFTFQLYLSIKAGNSTTIWATPSQPLQSVTLISKPAVSEEHLKCLFLYEDHFSLLFIFLCIVCTMEGVHVHKGHPKLHCTAFRGTTTQIWCRVSCSFATDSGTRQIALQSNLKDKIIGVSPRQGANNLHRLWGSQVAAGHLSVLYQSFSSTFHQQGRKGRRG